MTQPEPPIVDVRYNDFTGLWEVHGRKVTYWMFERQALRRAAQITAQLTGKPVPR